MDLKKFIKDIEKELELRMLNKNNTPILDRLEIHLEQLDKEYNLATMLNPQNLKSELYLSMLYQIVYPAKSKNTLCLEYNANVIQGKNNTQCLIELINLVGVDQILKTSYKEFIKDEIPNFLTKNILPSSYKPLKNGQYFDRSFGGKGINNHIKTFVKDLNEQLGLNIKCEFKTKIEYK